MYHIRMFSFSTFIVPNGYDYMRFPVRLWLSYGSLMANLGGIVRSGKANQFT